MNTTYNVSIAVILRWISVTKPTFITVLFECPHQKHSKCMSQKLYTEINSKILTHWTALRFSTFKSHSDTQQIASVYEC